MLAQGDVADPDGLGDHNLRHAAGGHRLNYAPLFLSRLPQRPPHWLGRVLINSPRPLP
jgi:hypothetical protein